MNVFGCELGREYKLSISELFFVFPKMQVLYSDKGVLIFSGYSQNDILTKTHKIGGTIKIFELEMIQDAESIIEKIITQGKNTQGKYKYSINLFGKKDKTLDFFLKMTKNKCKSANISARYFNQDSKKNLTSAQIIGNKILKKGYDYNIIDMSGIYYFGKTIWIQDIDMYSQRDYGKKTDMQTGMLPPKLAQMMINIASGTKIYDPFVGLATVLIESIYMGNSEVFGSDINEKMIDFSRENLKDISKKYDFHFHLKKLNAKFVGESEYLKNADAIVSEGYLGEIMTQNNISKERIEKQKKSLEKMYESFFSELKKVKFGGNIVMCFPFWEIKGKYIYFEEIYQIIQKYCCIENLFPENFENMTTKSGSLLYKRKKQLVGREIFRLTIKK